jgi:hypothetical protein
MTVYESARGQSQCSSREEISEVPTKDAQKSEWKTTFNAEGLRRLSTFPQRSSSQQPLYFSKFLKVLVVVMLFVNKLHAGKLAEKCRGCDIAHFHSTGKAGRLYTFGENEYSTAAAKVE